MKKYHIDFKDKRRVQRGMFAENEQEVFDYISKKYNLTSEDFIINEVKQNVTGN